jgi:hypothetical protein
LLSYFIPITVLPFIESTNCIHCKRVKVIIYSPALYLLTQHGSKERQTNGDDDDGNSVLIYIRANSTAHRPITR